LLVLLPGSEESICRLLAALLCRQANLAPQELGRAALSPIGRAFHGDATKREAGASFAPLLVMGRANER
jgi:hypothetical protein